MLTVKGRLAIAAFFFALGLTCFYEFAGRYNSVTVEIPGPVQTITKTVEKIVKVSDAPNDARHKVLSSQQVDYILSNSNDRMISWADSYALWDEQFYKDIINGAHANLYGPVKYEQGKIVDRYGGALKLTPPRTYYAAKVIAITPVYKRSFKVDYENGDYVLYGADGLPFRTVRGVIK